MEGQKEENAFFAQVACPFFFFFVMPSFTGGFRSREEELDTWVQHCFVSAAPLLRQGVASLESTFSWLGRL